MRPHLSWPWCFYDEAIRKAYLDYRYTMAAIARHAGVHYSTVSKVIKVIKGER